MFYHAFILLTAGLLNGFWGQSEIQTDPDTLFQAAVPAVEMISPEIMSGDERIIYIDDRWKFKEGDDPEWADPGYDDSDWEYISTNLTEVDLAFVDWEGIGWFRKHLQIAPELSGRPVALIVDRHLGASEIYLNGEKVHQLGSFSTDPSRVQTYHRGNPLVLIFPEQEMHTIAVRFINPDYIESERVMGYNGFRFLLGDWETHQAQKFAYISDWTAGNMFYLGILLAFAVIHFLIFVFYPAEKRNLYFSLFAGFLAVLSYLFYRVELAEFTFETMFFLRFLFVTEILVLVFATTFTHSIDRRDTPVYANFLLIAGVMIAILIWVDPVELAWLREVTVLVFVIEILRSIGVMFYRKRSGIWVLGTGVLVFVCGLIYSELVNINVITGNPQYGNMFGAGILILSMSIYLSREFASTQKSLISKLDEVKQLSKKALEQERIGKEREIEKRLLEAENERKTSELEEARALQLSMLPKKMPELPGYDLAVFMDTATEVGGDYYDYSVEQDGSMVLALGDATGHGMKAGIMVAAAKSYFHTLVHETDSLTMMSRISSGLQNMDMHMMYMGLILVHCNQNSVIVTIAGMPPVLHFRKAKGSVERIILKGLPLGSKVNYPYQTRKLELNPGDVLLMMSDGLTELFNSKKEMLGIDRVESLIQNMDNCSATDIVLHLKHLIEKWSEGVDPHDDVTLMVLRVPE